MQCGWHPIPEVCWIHFQPSICLSKAVWILLHLMKMSTCVYEQQVIGDSWALYWCQRNLLRKKTLTWLNTFEYPGRSPPGGWVEFVVSDFSVSWISTCDLPRQIFSVYFVHILTNSLGVKHSIDLYGSLRGRITNSRISPNFKSITGVKICKTLSNAVVSHCRPGLDLQHTYKDKTQSFTN